jgi:hypothetical protein
MRRIVLGLLLLPLIACGDVLAEDAPAPNAQAVNAPSPIDHAKHRKPTSLTRPRTPSAAALPLSSAETYASEHPGNLAISSATKPAPPPSNSPGNSWTGFYVGAGAGAQP